MAAPLRPPPLRLLFPWLLVSLLHTGCAGLLEQAGNELGRGLLKAADTDGPRAVRSLTDALGDGLRDDVLTVDTDAEVAHLISVAGASAQVEVGQLRDELLSARTEEQLQHLLETLLAVAEKRAERTARGVVAELGEGLRDDVLSRQNEERMQALLVALTQTLRQEGVKMRDDMLDREADRRVRVLVGAAMDEVVVASERIREKAHAELSFVQRNATLSILLACGLGAFVAFLIWRQKERNRLLLNLLLGQVHAASADREDEILARLDSQARQLGVQRLLEAVLAQRRRLGASKASEEREAA